MELDNVALQKKLRVHFQAQLECLPSLIAVPQGKGHHKAALVLFDWQERVRDWTYPDRDEDDELMRSLRTMVTGRDPDIQGCASVARCSQNASRVC